MIYIHRLYLIEWGRIVKLEAKTESRCYGNMNLIYTTVETESTPLFAQLNSRSGRRTRRFDTADTNTRYYTRPWASYIHSISPQTNSSNIHLNGITELRGLIAVFSPRRPGFEPGQVM
jgi:hypothetical protein